MNLFSTLCTYDFMINKITCTECEKNYTIIDDRCYLIGIENCQSYSFININDKNQL